MGNDKIFPPQVYVSQSSEALGRGVFAARAFSAGEKVDTCPVVILLKPLPQLPPRIRTLVYSWSSLIGGAQPSTALVLGYGSLYNHDNPANLRYVANEADQTIEYFACRDVECHEELTINYNNAGGEAVSTDDCWFRQNDIHPIVS